MVAWLTADFDRQIKEAGQLIEEHPGNSDAFRWRSMAYTALGDYDRARADLDTFGALTNMHLYTLVGLGIVAALEGQTAEAQRIIHAMTEPSVRTTAKTVTVKSRVAYQASVPKVSAPAAQTESS